MLVSTGRRTYCIVNVDQAEAKHMNQDTVRDMFGYIDYVDTISNNNSRMILFPE